MLFGKTKDDLQQSLHIFENYCEEWKLTINISKTKVLIFSGGRYSKNCNFYFKNVKLDLVSEYKYLGIDLSKSGSFLNCKKHLAKQLVETGAFDARLWAVLVTMGQRCTIFG